VSTVQERDAERARYRIEALAKGLQVLAAFADSHRSLKTADLAAEAGLPIGTTFRIVATLEEFGYLEKSADGGYRPGLSALRLAGAAARSSSLLEASERPLRRLADLSGETVNLGVLTDDRVMYLARLRNADLVTANVQVGTTLPAVYTSMGKALLAALDDDAVRRRITSRSFTDYHAGPNAVTDFDALLHRLAMIRATGYAVQDEELARGLRSIAVAVRNHDGTAVAAINVAVAVDDRTVAALIDDLVPPLREAAREISTRLEH
jgi:IclR family pca regulon transcriptional regulator